MRPSANAAGAQAAANTARGAQTDFAADYAEIVRLGKAIPAGVDMPSLLVQLDRAAEGTDIRALVVGGEVVASMKRTCGSGEFRANLHRGGRAEPVVITEEERKAALRSAEALGLNVAGVDMLRSSRGPVVIEVNSSPGIEGMEKATGVDLAGAMLGFLERRAGCGETRTSGVG